MNGWIIKTLSLLLIGFMLTGCMPFTPEKAPCDQYATGCGQKTKINQW